MPRAATQKKSKAATDAANSKTKGEGKAKRAPSAYNLFMAEHLKKWKADNPDKQVKEGMAAVAALWREAPENPKRGQTGDAAKAPAKKATATKPASKSKPAAKPKSKPKSKKEEVVDEEDEDEEKDEDEDEE